MKTILMMLLLAGVGISVQAETEPVKRDPFWPIGYDPAKAAVRAASTTPESEAPEIKPEAPILTDEELRKLAQDEAERIRQSLRHQATMTAGNRIFAYIQNKWVTAGDTLTVEVRGNTYRLEILHLTSDNIQLEAHATTQ